METKHTPEPWMTVKGNGIPLTLPNGNTHSFPIIWSKKAHMDVAYIVPMDDTKHADADRIVACVNALAGLNPEGVRDAVDALRLSEIALGDKRIGTYDMDSPDWYDKVSKARTAVRAALANLEDVK